MDKSPSRDLYLLRLISESRESALCFLENQAICKCNSVHIIMVIHSFRQSCNIDHSMHLKKLLIRNNIKLIIVLLKARYTSSFPEHFPKEGMGTSRLLVSYDFSYGLVEEGHTFSKRWEHTVYNYNQITLNKPIYLWNRLNLV